MRAVLSTLAVLTLSFAIQGSTAKVRHVSDGDSFILDSGERVRMIGVNSPELAEPFGPEAKAHLAKLIGGRTVTLEGDPQNDDRDVHGRLLRFVALNGVDINRRMIADGFAYAFLRYPLAREKREAYREAERIAKNSQLGIWARGSGETTPAPAANDDRVVDQTAPDNRSFLSANGWWIILGLILFATIILVILFGRRS